MDPDDEFASYALGYRTKPSQDASKFNPDISIRYNNDQLLRIYKNLGKFEHPLTQMQNYGLDPRDDGRSELLAQITTIKPDIMTEFLKEDIDQRRTKAQASRQELVRYSLDSELETQTMPPGMNLRGKPRDAYFKHPLPFSVGGRLKNPTPAYFKAEDMLRNLNSEIRLNLK